MKKSAGDGIVVIKKYANRRLYDTNSSCYITLDHLAAMTRAGNEFKVVDAKTDEDITHNILTQIIMDEEGRGQTMLPVNFLRQLIALYGDSMQAMVPGYLEASMDSFRRNQQQFATVVEGAFGHSPLAEITKRNMQVFEAAAQAFGGVAGTSPTPGNGQAPVPDEADTSKDEEIAALRAELAKLRNGADASDEAGR